jgi:hypothetical protein
MKLAPTAGVPGVGSVDEHLDTIEADTDAINIRLPSDPADESNQLAQHTATQVAIAALNDLTIADVQTAMTNQGYTSVRAALIDLIKKILQNRLELADGSANNWILYDDDDTTPLLTWSVSDKDGAAITQITGAPSRRTRGT